MITDISYKSIHDKLNTWNEGSIERHTTSKYIFKSLESKDEVLSKIDMIICIGGDGTLLYTSSLFQVFTIEQ